jgi:hypothetical protein
VRDFFKEWAARRSGRKKMGPNDLGKAARHMAGPTGELWSNGWERMAKDKDAYLKSFDNHIPPSIFVSERDRTRMNQPMPLPERAIADVVADPSTKPTPHDYEEAFKVLDDEPGAAQPPHADTGDLPEI